MAVLTEGSLFAGIMGFGEGFRRAGFVNKWAVEIEPFCQAVIRTRFPETQVFKDVRECGKHNLAAVDVITAGFPCQDLSVAGKRAGLGGSRSGLFWELHRILGELRPAWFVIENVPGLFSSNEGRDFALVVNSLDELGYGLAWRVLDSQYFGVAQRRRRVFIVGRFGEPCPAEVLFESAGGAGDFAEGREASTDIARTLSAGINGTGGTRDAHRQTFIPVVAATLRESDGHHGRSSPRGDGCDNLIATLNSGGNSGGFRTEPGEHIVIQDVRGGTRDKTDAGQGIGIGEGGPSYTLGVTEQHAVAYQLRRDPGGIGQGWNTNFVPTTAEQPVQQQRPGNGSVNAHPGANECAPANSERMRDAAILPQGLDSARYRALGNAVTANVSEWIAKRIGERILTAEQG